MIKRKIELEELLSDTAHILTLTIPGQPATKKTSQRILQGRILPSKAFCAYEKHCKDFCEMVWKNEGNEPINFGVNVKIKVFLKSWIVGDACGYFQSVGDILQKYGILANDSWINWDSDEHWFGGVDRLNPRIEIIISRKRHLKEVFRADKENKEISKEARRVNKELSKTQKEN